MVDIPHNQVPRLSFTSEGIKRSRTFFYISSCSFVILEMEGQVERNALWDTKFHAMCSVLYR